MAKKRRSTATKTKIIRVAGPAAKTPIIRVTTPRAAPVRRRRRRSSGGGSRGHNLGGIISNETLQMAVGGAIYGFAVKSGIVGKLPAIPVLGRTGTAAILLDYWSRHGGGVYAGRAARAAAAIAGYQLGHEGAISGDFVLGNDDATTPGSLSGDDMDGYEPEDLR